MRSSSGLADATVDAHRDRVRSASPAHLMATEPVCTLLSQWRADLVALEQRAPNSDAVPSLARCVQELDDAITRASQMPIELSLSEAQSVCRISLRHLQRLCLTAPEVIGARRHGRKWFVDRVAFDAYLSTTTPTGDLFQPVTPRA